ncbi:MAG: NAD-dependent epimerase/dehydratase family protein [Puniceicoccales bacterium]|jgi:UDP-glucose 4-epimerase|nr:NAD-dependent epimerase/dehydratase family protein [Puniceicoccales bacterium]
MRVLVVGGAGYLGSHLVHGLLKRGDEAVVIDNLLTGQRGVLPQKVPFFQTDGGLVMGVEDVLRKYAIDACVICSLFNGGERSLKMPFHYYHNNFIAVFYLLQTLIKHGIRRVVLSSSLDIYGPNAPEPVDENTPVYPANPLGKTLSHCEDLLADLVRAEKLSCIVFRMGNIGGAAGDGTIGPWPGSDNLITALTDVAFGAREHISIPGDPIYDILHVADAAEAHMVALRRLGNQASMETFVLASGMPLPLSQIIAMVKNVTHREIFIRDEGTPLDLVPTAQVDVTLAVRELWRHAPLGMERVLHDAWEWRKKFSKADGRGTGFLPNIR